jgi:WD40 repeat protein
MQHVPGESLQQRLARRGRLPAGETLALLADCLCGLGAAHAAGLVHRDVKPGNVLLDTRGIRPRALVADFGLARRVDGTRHTATGVILGTVEYMAPEQGQGLPADARSDLYSLGVVAYQTLAGRLPLGGRTPAEVLFKHSFEKPRPLAEAAPHVPAALAAVVDRLLAKDPAKRFPSCASVLDALGVLLTPNAAAAPPDATLAALLTPTPPAAAELEERLAELTALIAQAEEVRRELAAQAGQYRADAGKRASGGNDAEGVTETLRERGECERLAEGLEAHAAEQQRLLDELRGEQGRVAAETAGFRQPSKRRRLLPLVVAGCLLVLSAFGLLLWWVVGGTPRQQETPNANVPQVEKEVEIASILKDAHLLMTFEEKWFDKDKEGKTYVRDLSGHGNDALCVGGIKFDPQGKAGGGLSNDGKGRLQLPRSLIHKQSAFTVAAWVWLEGFSQEQSFYGTVSLPTMTPLFGITLQRGRGVFSNAWNADQNGHWAGGVTGPMLEAGKWLFVAVRLDDGGTGRGRYVVQVNDRVTETPLQMIKHPDSLHDVAFLSCKGRMDELAIWTRALTDEEISRLRERGRNGHVLLDAEQERKVTKASPPPPPVSRVSPTRNYQLALARPKAPKEQSWVNCVCFAPTGKQVYFGLDRNQGDGTYVGLLDLASGKVSCKIGYRGAIWGLDHTQQGGNLLLVGSYWATEVGLFDGRTGGTVRLLKGHTGPVWGVAFSADGKLAVSASVDRTARVWSVADGQEVVCIKSERGIIMAASFSPDGMRLLGVDRDSHGGKEGAVRIWDLKDGKLLRELVEYQKDVGDAAFTPDGKFVLVGGTVVRLLDVETGKEVRQFQGARGRDLTFSPDGKRFALRVPGAPTFRVWDFESGWELAQFVGHSSHVTGLSFSPDGRRIATSSFDGYVMIWDVPDPPAPQKGR